MKNFNYPSFSTRKNTQAITSTSQTFLFIWVERGKEIVLEDNLNQFQTTTSTFLFMDNTLQIFIGASEGGKRSTHRHIQRIHTICYEYGPRRRNKRGNITWFLDNIVLYWPPYGKANRTGRTCDVCLWGFKFLVPQPGAPP